MLREFQTESHLGVCVVDTIRYSNAANDDQIEDEPILRSSGRLQKLRDADIDKYRSASAPEFAGDNGDTEFLGQKLGTASLD